MSAASRPGAAATSCCLRWPASMRPSRKWKEAIPGSLTEVLKPSPTQHPTLSLSLGLAQASSSEGDARSGVVLIAASCRLSSWTPGAGFDPQRTLRVRGQVGSKRHIADAARNGAR
jgi:hypothetical protein